MSDYFPASIFIGGKITRQLFERIKQIIPVQIQDDYLFFNDQTAENGKFEELEEFLIHNKIPFTRRSESYYEFPEEVVQYRSSMETPCCSIYVNGKQVVSIEVLNEIYQVADFPQTVRNMIQKIYFLEKLPFFEILE